MLFRQKMIYNNGKNNNIKSPKLKKFKISVNENNNTILIDPDITQLKGNIAIFGDYNTIQMKLHRLMPVVSF